ncbi:hypothetical protein KC345_g6450 [Hortaea werneckii]|nr:hypothetical protein KC345_g6450 [Hortaea werneckii]
MHLSFTVVAMSCFVASALSAAIAEKRCVGHGYATFYNDHACKVNPSVAHSMGNDGCIGNQIGRNSIYIQGDCFNEDVSMVWSPGTGCNCQDDCAAVPNKAVNHCWDLGGHAAAKSFRFIREGCSHNNC